MSCSLFLTQLLARAERGEAARGHLSSGRGRTQRRRRRLEDDLECAKQAERVGERASEKWPWCEAEEVIGERQRRKGRPMHGGVREVRDHGARRPIRAGSDDEKRKLVELI